MKADECDGVGRNLYSASCALWLQGEEVCCNESGEECRALHRDGSR